MVDILQPYRHVYRTCLYDEPCSEQSGMVQKGICRKNTSCTSLEIPEFDQVYHTERNLRKNGLSTADQETHALLHLPEAGGGTYCPP